MGFELEKRIASELGRLVSDDAKRPGADESELSRPGKNTRVEQFKRLAAELERRLLGAEAERGLDETAPVPGKQTHLDGTVEAAMAAMSSAAHRAREALAQITNGAQATVAAPSNQGRARLDDFRASGLKDVLRALRTVPAKRRLQQETLSAADPVIASRASRATPKAQVPEASGQALWRVAERRAATLYRQAQDAGEITGEDPVVEAALARTGGGHALPTATRKKMERELGFSLERVRIHTDSVAAGAARAVRAQAFTVGEDIFFAEAAFAPDSREGQKLLAHELTHVVQAWEGRTSKGGRGISVSQPNESLEREADAVAERVANRAPRVTTSRKRAAASTKSTSAPDAATARGPARLAARPAPAAIASPSRMLLRKPAGNSSSAQAAPNAGSRPTQQKGDIGPNGERAMKPHIKVSRDAAKEHAGRQLHKATANFTEARNELTKKVSGAAKGSLTHLKHGVETIKHKPVHHRAHGHQQDEDKHHHAHQKHAHDAAKKHHAAAAKAAKKKAKHHPAHHHHAPDTATVNGIQFKKISDWNKYMPAPLPGQDARERKRLLKLVQKQVNGDRAQSAKSLAKLKTAQAKQAAAVKAMGPKLQGEIAGAQSAALGAVSSAEAAQCGAVQAHVAGVQAAVRGHAAAMAGQIASAHQAAMTAIKAAAKSAVQKLQQAQTTALSDIDTAESTAITAVAALYTAAKADIIAAGAAKAGEASALGDSISLPYDGDKLDAAKKAAHETASQYASAMPDEASKAASQVGANQSKSETDIRKMATDQRKAVQDTFKQAKQAIDQAEQQATTAATQIKASSTSQVQNASSSTCAQLAAHGASQVAAIRQQASGARSGISSAGAAAQAGIAKQVSQAASGIQKGTAGILSGAKKLEAPNPEETNKTVSAAIKQLGQGTSQIGAGLNKTAAGSAASLRGQASSAASGMAQTAQAANGAADQMGAGAKASMSQIAQGASTSLTGLAKGFGDNAKDIAQNGEKGMQKMVEGLTKAYSAAQTSLGNGLTSTVADIKGSFDKAVPGQETTDILAAAKKAADAVKPWWQKALAVVASVVVAIVVVVVVTALIVTTGPVGAILVGAAAGALGSVAGTMASNLVLGNGLTEGITWQSVAMGAVGGGVAAGLSAGLSAGAGALATSGSRFATAGARLTTALEGGAGLGNYGIRMGVNVANDAVSDAASQLIVTGKYEFSVENLVTSIATNSITSTHSYETMQQRAQTRLTNAVGGPLVTIGTPRANTTGGGHTDVSGGPGSTASSSSSSSSSSHSVNTDGRGVHVHGDPSSSGGAHPEGSNTGGSSHSNGSSSTPNTQGASPTPSGNHAGGDHATPGTHANGEHTGTTPTGNENHTTGGGRTGDQGANTSGRTGDHPTNEHTTPAPTSERGPGHAANDNTHGPGEHAPGEHAAKGNEHATGEHGPNTPHEHAPGEHAPGEHAPGHDTANAKGDHTPGHDTANGPGEHAPGHDAAPQGEHAPGHDAAHPGDHAPGHEAAPGGEGEHAAEHEQEAAAHDSEMNDLGYPEGTREKGKHLADEIEAGSKPKNDSLRDTEANQKGSKELEQVKHDTKLTAEEKAKLNKDVADHVRAKEEPTGNLHGDVAEAKARAKAEKEAAQAKANSEHAPGEHAAGDKTPGETAPAHEGAQTEGPKHDPTQGLADPVVHEQFSAKMHELKGEWAKLTPEQRSKRMGDALNEQLRAQGLPEVEVKAADIGGRNGEFDFQTWSVTLSEKLGHASHVDVETMKSVTNTIIHEARHAEQWYMVARHMLGEGKSVADIARATHMPEHIVERAAHETTPMTPEQAAAAKRYYESIYGANAQARNDTINGLSTKPEEARRAWENYDRVNKDPSATYEEKLAAWEAADRAQKAKDQNYQDYRNLPEEADAWAVGDAAGDHFGKTGKNDHGDGPDGHHTPTAEPAAPKRNAVQRLWDRVRGRTKGPNEVPPGAHDHTPKTTEKPASETAHGKGAGKDDAPRQHADNLDQLYKDAAAAQTELSGLTQHIADELGGKALIPTNLKGRERAQEKINADYGGDPSRIVDLARSSIEFDNPNQLRQAMDKLGKSAEIVRVKDRFEKPADGYRDVMMNLKMSNGHIVEVQLHLKAILEVKNGPGHALYEQVRAIDARAKTEKRPLTAEETARREGLVREMTALYDHAYEASKGTPEKAPGHGDDQVVGPLPPPVPDHTSTKSDPIADATGSHGDDTPPPVLAHDLPKAGTRVTRQDNDFSHPTNYKGQQKPRLGADGHLEPASPSGAATILEHVIGRSPHKDDSPFTSFMTVDGTVAKAFGAHEIEVDVARLQHDIRDGKVKDVEVFSPHRVQAAIHAEIEKVHPGLDVEAALAGGSPGAIHDYLKGLGLSKRKTSQLMDRVLALHNTRRDGEWLIRGVVPKTYFGAPKPTGGGGGGGSTHPPPTSPEGGGAPPVQRSSSGEHSDLGHQRPAEVARNGTQGAGGGLPFERQIQASFGKHDVGGVRAHTGGAAQEAATGLNAKAFAIGDAVAFASAPDLHTAAHEAAHVVQQRSGVSLKGGIDQPGDVHEQHADVVAISWSRGSRRRHSSTSTPGPAAVAECSGSRPRPISGTTIPSSAST